jgi:hypothetical protein
MLVLQEQNEYLNGTISEAMNRLSSEVEGQSAKIQPATCENCENLESLEIELQNTKNTLRENSDREEHLNREFLRNNEEISNLKIVIDQNSIETEFLKRQISNSTTTQQCWEQQHQDLSQRNQHLTTDYNQLAIEIAQKDFAIKELSLELNEYKNRMKDEVQDLTANVDWLRKRADSESETFKELKKDLISDHKTQKDEWLEKNRGLTKKNEDYYEQICCKDIEIRSLRVEIENSQKLLAQMKAGGSGEGLGDGKLGEENKTLRGLLEQQHMESEKMLGVKDGKIEILELTIAGLGAARREMEGEVRARDAKILAVKNENGDLRRQVIKRERPGEMGSRVKKQERVYKKIKANSVPDPVPVEEKSELEQPKVAEKPKRPRRKAAKKSTRMDEE